MINIFSWSRTDSGLSAIIGPTSDLEVEVLAEPVVTVVQPWRDR